MASLTDRLEIERQLTAQLIRLSRRIERLQKEKQKLEALIIAHRAGALPQKGALRKNAVSKSTTTTRILNIIRDAKRPISTHDVLSKIRSELIEINESTFRSYIFRLKTDGIIEVKGRRGYYVIVNSEPPMPTPRTVRKILIRKPSAMSRGDK